jgi:hypothetical protein
MAKYCSKCELPKKICACAEAKAYDKANPLKPRWQGDLQAKKGVI